MSSPLFIVWYLLALYAYLFLMRWVQPGANALDKASVGSTLTPVLPTP